MACVIFNMPQTPTPPLTTCSTATLPLPVTAPLSSLFDFTSGFQNDFDMPTPALLLRVMTDRNSDSYGGNIDADLQALFDSFGNQPTAQPEAHTATVHENHSTVNPEFLQRTPTLPSSVERKRKRSMSAPRETAEQDPHAKRHRPSDVGRLPPMMPSEWGPLSTAQTSNPAPRYPRIFDENDQPLSRTDSSYLDTVAQSAAVGRRYSSQHASASLHVRATPHTVSNRVSPSLTYETISPRRFHSASPASHPIQQNSAYKTGLHASTNQARYPYTSSPSINYISMPPLGSSITTGSATYPPPRYSPANSFATLQPLTHSQTFPSYGPISTSAPYDPYHLSRSSTYPTSLPAPRPHSPHSSTHSIHSANSAHSATASIIARVTSEQSRAHSATPHPHELDAGESTEEPEKPRCFGHGCNGREFSTFSNLLRHQRERAGSVAKVSCPECGVEFTRTTARNSHVRLGKCKGAGGRGVLHEG